MRKIRTSLLFAGLLAATMLPAQAGPEDALTKATCTACHAQDKKLVGPAFKEIAAKYRGQKDAAVQLADKVRKGGKGVWGPIPMPASGADKISDAELKAALDWMLAL
jgi:cytochrome c